MARYRRRCTDDELGAISVEQFAWIGIALFLIVAAAAALKIYWGDVSTFVTSSWDSITGTRRELTPFRPHRDAGERGSISVTGIVVFFTLIFLLVVGTNWVDDDLALGAFRTVVSEAAQTGALEGAPGGRQDACYEAAARAETDLVSGPLARGTSPSHARWNNCHQARNYSSPSPQGRSPTGLCQ